MTKKKEIKPKSTPTKRGRPTKYKSEFCDRLVALGKLGKSRVQCACEFDVHTDSLHEWAKVHDEFSVAMKKAQTHAEAFWENRIAEIMLDGDNGSGRSPISMFYMKCRFGWRDRDATQLNVNANNDGPGETKFVFNTLPDSKFDPGGTEK